MRQTTGHNSAPRIRMPPPAIFVAAFLIGLGLNALVPIRLHATSPSALWRFVPWVLIGPGLAFSFWGFVTVVRARSGVLPNQPVTRLVVHGPYRLSRNPMYTGLALAYVGCALWANSLWPLAMLPPALWFLWIAVIQKEEAFLANAFGAAYKSYRGRVRRWI